MARAASLAVRRAKAALRKRLEASRRNDALRAPYYPKPGVKRPLKKTQMPSDSGELFYTGEKDWWKQPWTDASRYGAPWDALEEGAPVATAKEKTAKQKRRDELFAEQREMTGKAFFGNWYPRGDDGKYQDPHYGETSKEAPYGYVDLSGENPYGDENKKRVPRTEPLYDASGRPIIPRPAGGYGPERAGVWPFQKDYSVERDLFYARQQLKAEAEWGRFGEKKRFFEKNPGATAAGRREE